MKKYLAAAASLLSLAALGACGESPAAPEPTSVSVAAAAPSPKATPADQPRSSRGALLKQVGEPAGIRMDEGSDEWALSFTVTGIEVDPVCTGPYPEPAENGHLVAISIEAATGPEPGFSEVLYNGVSFGSQDWKVIASNGTTVNNNTSVATYGCFPPAEILPNSIGAAEKVSGKILLDVPDPAGTLVLSSYGENGWEYEYGTK